MIAVGAGEIAVPRYGHLRSMTDSIGLFEHALFTAPRPEHGYCVDDVARGLVVLCRIDTSDVPAEPADDAGELAQIAWRYLQFIRATQTPDGRVVNRCDVRGHRTGPPGVEDAWGRALWGLGTAASRGRDPELAAQSMAGFELSAAQRSPWPHAMAFAGLGAAEVLRVDSAHRAARALLRDAAGALAAPREDAGWPWPMPRLTYANAVFPDVLLAAGECLGDEEFLRRGLALLDWLLEIETAEDGHLSVTPTGGWGRGEPRPGFDQQPIEVSTLADACARAFEITGDPRWSAAVVRAAAWFHGANDAGVTLADPLTGGCCDGLQSSGRNQNQGAESTLALASTLQHARRLATAL